MPQLEIADFLPQLFWLAVTFTVLYIILAKVSLPRVSAVREQRATKIADDLDAAEKLKRQADEAQAAHAAALNEARTTAQKIASDARDAIKARSEARQKEINAKLTAEAEAAEARIQAAKAEALANVRDVATEACSEIVAKLTGLKLDDSVVRQAVDAAFAQSVTKSVGGTH